MSISQAVKKILPPSVKNWLKNLAKKNQILNKVSPLLSECICVDVGASFGPHAKWNFFLQSPKTLWIAVEPNEKNISYIDTWSYPCRVKAIPFGLSQEGGLKKLHITNVDTGSSLLEPIITPSMKHRIQKEELDYFFPLRIVEIETLALEEVIPIEEMDFPILVKLDTQGSELSILKGATHLFKKHLIVGVEMESTLLAQPIMCDSKKFWEACQYLEELGLELLDLTPIRAKTLKGTGRGFLNECDAVFALRRDVAKDLPVKFRIALFGFYLTYQLYEEAYLLLQDDSELKKHFNSLNADVDELSSLIYKMM